MYGYEEQEIIEAVDEQIQFGLDELMYEMQESLRERMSKEKTDECSGGVQH